MAYLRLIFAAYRLKAILRQQEKFNPCHDEVGRFTNADGAVTSGGSGTSPSSSTSGNPKIAFAGAAEKAA
jgi:hypothetical protein